MTYKAECLLHFLCIHFSSFHCEKFFPAQISVIDDEYRWAGTADPKIVITTSRLPSATLKVFAKVHFCYKVCSLILKNKKK